MDQEATAIDVPPVAPGIRIDEPAPPFVARSTHGVIRLSDFRGRWLLFFSHPADFTPVCTSEFVSLQRQIEQFEALDCALLGLSVDSLYAHLAWIRDIEQRFGEQIGFPIVEDISMAVARAYGMVHPGSSSTAAVRSVFFIDPEGTVRALMHYPESIGRSVAELLRVLAALRQTASGEVTTPEGWTAGQPTLLPPPLDKREADERAARHDGQWYYAPSEEEQ